MNNWKCKSKDILQPRDECKTALGVFKYYITLPIIEYLWTNLVQVLLRVKWSYYTFPFQETYASVLTYLFSGTIACKNNRHLTLT